MRVFRISGDCFGTNALAMTLGTRRLLRDEHPRNDTGNEEIATSRRTLLAMTWYKRTLCRDRKQKLPLNHPYLQVMEKRSKLPKPPSLLLSNRRGILCGRMRG